MQNNNKKILVLFVEPMHYGFDLIREVYQKTEFTYQYVYCYMSVTGKDNLALPKNAIVCSGTKKERQQQIRDIFKSFAPDFAIINGYVGTEQVEAIRYCKKNKIKYAIESDTPLHIPSSKIKAYLKKQYLKTLLKNKHCFAFPGGTMQKENFLYYGVPEERCYIMPMSIDENRLLKASEELPTKEQIKEKYGFSGKKVFLFVGRLAEVKNVELLIRAFADLKKEESEVALCLVGDGNLKKELEGLSKELALSDVCFAGYVGFPENVEFYKMADAFVLPSLHESWGLVVNEAMIMGLPVIVSTKVGCGKDLVKENENGFVFIDGDKDGLKECMKKMLQSNIEKMGESSLSIIGKWNFNYYLESFLNAVNNEGKF